jgi:hypothetical protein
MAARGPKSAAALSVVTPVAFDGRPPPPNDLTEAQQEMWRRVVAAENAGFFNTAALQLLLKEFVRHTDTAQVLTGLIDSFDPAWLATDEGLARYGELLKLRDRETKALGDKATKLRLTNQSRYTPQAAATASKNTKSVKLWERHA